MGDHRRHREDRPPFLLLFLTIAFEIGLVLGSFAVAFQLRAGHFRLYIAASLACWLLAAWLSVAAMHTLGAFYAVRRDSLEWRHRRARWGVGWKA